MSVRIRGVHLLGVVLFLSALPGWQTAKPDDYAAGLAIWRKPDKEGRACASCHSPDGIELAAYRFDTATIERRATPHLGAADAAVLARYIIALRERLGLKGDLDPMIARPMQPGASVLPGATPEARDRSFALSLYSVLPLLMEGRIGTLTQAKAALSQVLRLDPSQVKIGIPLDRISEDVFHGKEHAIVGDWIPDQVLFTYSPDYERAQGTYLVDPSDQNLKNLDAFYTKLWRASLTPAKALALEKARSLLLLQHRLRTGRLAIQLPEIPDMTKAPTNPFWEIGELGRIYSNSRGPGLGLPADVVPNKSEGPSFAEQFQSMRIPWLWLGWIIDPGLQRTSFDRRTRYADWFSEFLVEDGPYPAHAAFMLTKKLADEGYGKEGWGSPMPQHLDLNFSWVLRNDNWRTFASHDATYRKALYTFLANSFRMFALLQTDELSRTGVTYLREPVVQQLKFMQAAAAVMDSAHTKEDVAVFQQAIKAVDSAKLVS